jgi:hypothetical protein
MKYFQTWQDFMRDPANKALKESKGIHACKQKFIQEQNKMMWHDPIIIQENQSPGQSVNNAVGADGSSTPFITGNVAEITTFTFTGAVAGDNLWTASNAAGSDEEWYFDVEAYDGSTDYSATHTNSMKKFRFFIVSGSGPLNDRNFTPTIPASINGVVTASATHIAARVITAADDVNITGSILGQFVHTIVNQAATETVAGFTNTIAPADLFTAITGSTSGEGYLQITNKYKSAVAAGSTAFASTTASIATSTAGSDTYFHDKDATDRQVFDGDVRPYSNLPRKADGSTTTQPS